MISNDDIHKKKDISFFAPLVFFLGKRGTVVEKFENAENSSTI